MAHYDLNSAAESRMPMRKMINLCCGAKRYNLSQSRTRVATNISATPPTTVEPLSKTQNNKKEVKVLMVYKLWLIFLVSHIDFLYLSNQNLRQKDARSCFNVSWISLTIWNITRETLFYLVFLHVWKFNCRRRRKRRKFIQRHWKSSLFPVH